MNRVITLGFFDGVHLGHGALIRQTVKMARECEASACVLTFSSHPMSEIGSAAVKTITSLEDRKALLHTLFGIDDVIVMPFDKRLMNTMPREFVERLRQEFGAVGLVCGYDFRFGKGNSGSADTLRELCEEYGMRCAVVDEVFIGAQRVSSTLIRECLQAGELDTAEEYMGHAHIMTGDAFFESTMGNTTVRILPDSGVMLPMPGIYDTQIETADGKTFPACTSVGENGTVSRLYGAAPDKTDRLTLRFVRYIGQ